MLKRIELYDQCGKCYEVESNIDLSTVSRIVIKYEDGSYEAFASENTDTAPRAKTVPKNDSPVSNRVQYMLDIIRAIREKLNDKAINNIDKVRGAYNEAVRDYAGKTGLTEPSIKSKFIRSVPHDFNGNKTDFWLEFLAGNKLSELRQELRKSCDKTRTQNADIDAIDKFFNNI